MKKLLRRMLCMCEPSYILFKYSLVISCVLQFCAFLVLLYAGELSPRNFALHLFAHALFETPAAILLVAALGTVLIEEQVLKQQ